MLTYFQIYHYASLLKAPKVDPVKDTYYISEDLISQYINPNEWKSGKIKWVDFRVYDFFPADFTATNLPTLNFIIYIPNLNNSLKIRLKTGKRKMDYSIVFLNFA